MLTFLLDDTDHYLLRLFALRNESFPALWSHVAWLLWTFTESS